MDNVHYLNRKKYVKWLDEYSYIRNKINFDIAKLKASKEISNSFAEYFKILENNESIISSYNNKIVENLKLAHKDFFDKIEHYPLDNQQRDCICHDEDATLVLAGAGTGKTSTIVGRTTYLIKKYNINPEEILLLSFTKKSSKELEERIKRVTQMEMNVYTFHKLGYEIISEVENEKKDIAFADNNRELSDYVESLFYKKLVDNNYLTLAKHFFLDFPHYSFFVSKTVNVDADGYTGDDGTKYKSKQEVLIANFLMSNQIKYEYEKNYEFKTASKDFRQYKPDFYLTDYKIYIEHFGIDKDGNPPNEYSEKEKKAYLKGMDWKRELHDKNKTKLIETYSYEFNDGSIFTKLEENLLAHDVTLSPIIKTRDDLKSSEVSKKKYPMIVLLFCSFLNLMKSNLKTFDQFNNILIQIVERIRYELFLKLFKPIYEEYEQFLRDNDKIDFSDMISKATEFVEAKKFIHNYKYIIIDEFQDMSFGRFKLIKAMLSQHDDMKLFCVGDDWQSIYRFTGTDISVITEFEKYFGYFKELKIENTYRFPENIIKVSTEIIKLNERQRIKTLRSSKVDDTLPVIINYYKNDTYQDTMSEILRGFENGNKIFLIGRYNYDKPQFLDTLTRQFPLLKLEFLTAHRAKGLEAENIILLNLIDELLGFPSKLVEDPVLNLVLRNLLIEYEEERRLFYVALTRTKNKIYVLNHTSKKPSLFLRQLIQICNKNFVIDKDTCPKCHGRILLRREYDNCDFYGCSRYPLCGFNKKEYRNRMLKNPIGNAVEFDEDLPF
jgi:DNA helicase-4